MKYIPFGPAADMLGVEPICVLSSRKIYPAMKKTLLLFLFLLSTQLAKSQAFEAGYLVLQRGDTLRGEVENDFWEEPPRVVRFRPGATAPSTAYAARQLRSVYLASGRLLRNELLPIDRNAESRMTYLRPSAERRQQPDSVLADVLVLGPASLLGIALHDTKHFFVQRPGQPYLEMTERRYLKTQNGTESIVDANDFKTQLLLYFGDCEAVTTLLPTTPFTEAGLRRVAQAFNQQCSERHQLGSEILERKPGARLRLAVRVGVIAGVRYNSLQFNSPGLDGKMLDGANLDGKIHPQGGIYVDLVGSGRLLALHTALLVSEFGTSQPVSFTPLANAATGQYQWNGTLTTVQLGLRGLLPIGSQLRLLVGGGYEANVFAQSNSTFTYNNESRSFFDYYRAGLLPYLEAGLSRNRLAVILNGRLYKSDEFEQGYVTQRNTYTYQPWSLSLSVSCRLNGNSDASSPINR